MGKRSNLILIIVIIMLIMPIYLYFKSENNMVIENSYIKERDNNALSLMYETSVGSGEYVVSDDTVFPSAGYIFNEEKSNCQNGSKLIWNDEAKTVSVKVNNSDKCYVYFDKEVNLANVCQGQNMASCIATYYKLDSTIIKHDGTVTDATYGVIDAEDNNYRYAGPSESVKNFVCFGSDAEECPNDNLYRIIGVFNETDIETGKKELRLKLIKYDYALTNLLGTGDEYRYIYTDDTSYYKGLAKEIPAYCFNSASGSLSTNDWTISKLNTVNLNTNYINNIGDKWARKITNTIWRIGGMTWVQGSSSSNIAKTTYKNELGLNSIDKTYRAKIGLMYMSDYYYAANQIYWTYYGFNNNNNNNNIKDYSLATDSNWMFMGLNEWSISLTSEYTAHNFNVNITGYVYSSRVYDNAFMIRPTFYLKSSTTLVGGSGSITDPYRIV